MENMDEWKKKITNIIDKIEDEFIEDEIDLLNAIEKLIDEITESQD